MKEGDRNTSFFHRTTSGRKKRNRMDEITDDWEVKWTEEDDIERVFRDYFSELFTSRGNLDMDEAMEVVEHKITNSMEVDLSQLFKREEVTTTLFQMFPTKSPGRDLCFIFFKSSRVLWVMILLSDLWVF